MVQRNDGNRGDYTLDPTRLAWLFVVSRCIDDNSTRTHQLHRFGRPSPNQVLHEKDGGGTSRRAIQAERIPELSRFMLYRNAMCSYSSSHLAVIVSTAAGVGVCTLGRGCMARAQKLNKLD